MMLDTIGMKFYRKDLGSDWDIEKIKSRLQPLIKYDRDKPKPIGCLRNFRVYANYSELKIEGSLAKYYNKNNVEDFDWKFVKPAINFLSDEIELPLCNARLYRADVGANIKLPTNVINSFPTLSFLEYYQRISRHETSLRFENNSARIQLLFYDKLAEIENDRQLIKDNLRYLTDAENLLRVELQIQERLSQFLKVKSPRVSNLYDPEFCKLLMKKWFDLYKQIQKKEIPSYPKNFKGSPDFEKFIRRYVGHYYGLENLNYTMRQAVKQKSLTASQKSKKLKKFREALSDNSNLEFQEDFVILDKQMKLRYVEGIGQIYLLKKYLDEKAVK